MWILTSEINEYDQAGEYFVSAWLSKPTLGELQEVLPEEKKELLEHILRGGGQQETEYQWFYLVEMEPGVKYQDLDL